MAFNERVSIDQLCKILDDYSYKEFHIHHTWLPNYSTFYQKDSNGKNKYTPEQLNQNMKTFHVQKGWGDIAQHITTFPDGTILLGRGFSKRPASISGRNTGSFCMEQVGDFDLGKDIITVVQRNIALRLVKYFRGRGTKIVFHREYSSKTCPGTAFNKNGLISASDYYFSTGELRKGIFGADVAEVQKKLGLKADGSFGPATEKAVKEYQQSKGLPVTGIIDKKMMEKIGENSSYVAETPEETVSNENSIMGKSVVNEQQMVTFLLKHNAYPSLNTSVENIAKLYLKEGEIEGVRGDVAFAQAIKETGYFKFGGDVVPEQNNYAGIGTTGGGVKGAYFNTPQIGIQAQIQHLKAYASKKPLVQKCVDPRFNLVSRGIAPKITDLNGKWAVPGKGYGESIMKIIDEIKSIDGGEVKPVDPIKNEVKNPEDKPEWYESEWKEAKEKGITDGSRPKDFATRAEVAAMIMRSKEEK